MPQYANVYKYHRVQIMENKGYVIGGAVQMLCVDNAYTAKQMFVCVMLCVDNVYTAKQMFVCTLRRWKPPQ